MAVVGRPSAQILPADVGRPPAGGRDGGGVADVRRQDRSADTSRRARRRDMNLSDAGESRIHGYLFLLEQSLRTFLRRDVAADAVREVECHIRERVLDDDGLPNERDALNRLLEAMGPPHRPARAYSAELAVDEAVTTGRFAATVRAIVAMAFYTSEGFVVAIGLLCGYLISIALLFLAVLKPFFP